MSTTVCDPFVDCLPYWITTDGPYEVRANGEVVVTCDRLPNARAALSWFGQNIPDPDDVELTVTLHGELILGYCGGCGRRAYSGALYGNEPNHELDGSLTCGPVGWAA